ncbi:hypothetical protein [Staphylococcus americanisciuri]|uniref:Bacteriophage protein n=1 Tax=Staphylococcus americanisciuri TaxID=2973940 RepID=A0ABT2F1Q1_9STAP|nr:hypothetical protein [Staphylococcus americanisciuri]MCS4486383.1 hypothetical protein [Staphylococcus americanisciuri]
MVVKIGKGIKKSGVFFDEKAVLNHIEKKVGVRKLRKIYDLALEEAGKVVLDAVKSNIRHFRYTGAEYGEVKLSKPAWEGGKRTIYVYWEGPHDRYKIVHLNEKGYHSVNGKFIKPEGIGAIDRAMRSAKESFFKKIQEELEKHI